MGRICVVPSCRESCLHDFRGAWEGTADWDRLLVIEDAPRRSFHLPDSAWHCSWHEIEEALGDDAWIFSRRDSAIRAFGLLLAWRHGADLVVTLDDDCYPRAGLPICRAHELAMRSHPRWVPSVPGMRTRGLPYRNLGELPVVANMGLWAGVPDLDAVQGLSDLGAATRGDYEPPAGSRVIPAGQYFPLCAMNLAIRREAIPLFYFPLMGQGWPYRRFDDIWAGVLAKRALDHLGWRISVGGPHITHVRASDPFANLVKEAPGVAANETFWELVDGIELRARTAAGCMAELGAGLAAAARRAPRDDGDYLDRLGRALEVWASLFGAGS